MALLLSSALQDGPQSPPPITRHSSEQALDIAARLERLGAHMYGAYWCSHCYDQKQTLGVEGFAKVDYIECDPNGVNSRRSQCKARGITGCVCRGREADVWGGPHPPTDARAVCVRGQCLFSVF